MTGNDVYYQFYKSLADKLRNEHGLYLSGIPLNPGENTIYPYISTLITGVSCDIYFLQRSPYFGKGVFVGLYFKDGPDAFNGLYRHMKSRRGEIEKLAGELRWDVTARLQDGVLKATMCCWQQWAAARSSCLTPRSIPRRRAGR